MFTTIVKFTGNNYILLKETGITYRILFSFALLLLFNSAKAQFYYGTHQTYGKNRVQYNEFIWSFYRYERYDVYFYKSSKPIAQKVAILAEKNLRKIENFLDEPLDSRIQILVFTSLSDLKQSNVNISDDEAYNTGGVTRSAGTRMFVYFDGDYTHLEQQIREGLSYLLLSNMVYGGFTKSLKNSTLLHLPEWYVEGLISYLSRPWSPEIDQHVRDGFSSGSYERFNSLIGDEAKYAGHSIWNYISQTYGEGVVKNIIYMTIINRSVDQAFTYVLGASLEEISKNWRAYYEERYAVTINADESQGTEVVKSKKEQQISEISLSPNGLTLAYVANTLGEYRVYTYDLAKRKRKKLLKKGYKIAQNSDYSYPLLAWHPSNRILTMIIEDKGFIWLYFYDIKKGKKEKKKLFGFDKVLSISYSPDGEEILMSAVKKGQSDIFVYNVRTTIPEQITNDNYNDLYPEFLNGGKQIVFSSNRYDDTLRPKETVYKFKETNDLFIYNRSLPRKKRNLLWRITNTPNTNELRPKEYQPMNISFLRDYNGIQDQYILSIDSFVAYVDTVMHYDYRYSEFKVTESTRNIQEQDFSSEGERIARLIYKDGRYRIYTEELVDAQYLSDYAQSPSQEQIKAANKELKNLAIELDSTSMISESIKNQEIDINDYQFDERLYNRYNKSNKPVKKKKEEVYVPGTPKEERPKDEEIKFPPGRNYFTSFFKDNFTLQVDFVFDNPQYQPYSGRPTNDLLSAGFNVNFKIGTIDLFNNYRLVMGLRTDFQPMPGLSLSPNSELMIGAVNNKKRLDQQLTLYRRSRVTYLDEFFVNNTVQFLTRFLTYEGHYRISYPLNEIERLSLSGGVRSERKITLSDNPVSLQRPSSTTNHLVFKADYVYDNTRKKGLNLYHGTRFKVFTEYYKNVTTNNTGLHTAGVDFRTYMPITRGMVWANRFAFGTSWGEEKLVHYLGGVDNEISPKVNTDMPIDDTQNYIFQTVATNMRGFKQNVRNGNSFSVINSELRMPIFKMLMDKPIKSDFIANFQVVGFADVGSAWNGTSPYSDENSFNYRVIDEDNPNLTVIVKNQSSPIVFGTGFGLRTRILGYFVRADWAWGIQDGEFLPRIFYFSLSTDF